MSDRVMHLDLELALRQARQIFLADWVGGEVEQRDFEFRGRKFSLSHRLFTLLEDLTPPGRDVCLPLPSSRSPVLLSAHSGATSPPPFVAGTRIRVYSHEEMSQKLREELHPEKNMVWARYEPPRRVSEGRVILLLGSYELEYEAFPCVAGIGILPPELLEDVRQRLMKV